MEGKCSYGVFVPLVCLHHDRIVVEFVFAGWSLHERGWRFENLNFEIKILIRNKWGNQAFLMINLIFIKLLGIFSLSNIFLKQENH